MTLATGGIRPADEEHVGGNAKHVVNGEIEYIFVNRIHESIVRLQDDVDSAWPDPDGRRWLTNKLKECFRSCIPSARVRLLICNAQPFFPGYVSAVVAQGSMNNGTISMPHYRQSCRHTCDPQRGVG